MCVGGTVSSVTCVSEKRVSEGGLSLLVGEVERDTPSGGNGMAKQGERGGLRGRPKKCV